MWITLLKLTKKIMTTKSILKISGLLSFALVFLFSCKEDEYTMGALSSPTNLNIVTEIAGQDSQNPNGDGSGLVNITATADNVLSYRIAFTEIDNLGSEPEYQEMPAGKMTKKFSSLGDVNYRISVLAYGAGGSSTLATKDITVKSVYNPDPEIVANLTGGSTKTWVVAKAQPGHLGVGPYTPASIEPEWWSAAPFEKEGSADCLYAASFSFTQEGPTSFSMKSITPQGAFTKTGALSGIPGIPASGEEGCYPYAGGSSAFAFIESTSGVAASASTTTSILLSGNTTFIGYAATKKEYEILSITPTTMHLRVQGTETGNAWYVKLVAVE